MRRTTREERELFQVAVTAPHKLHAKSPAKTAAKRKPRKRVAQEAEPLPEEPAEHPGKRRTTREERELFESTLAGHASVKKSSAKTKTSRPASKPQAQKPPTGLDGNTARKLKRGEIAPGAKLDLHGMTEAAAHRALASFILAAHRRGDRLVLIVTGKGSPEGRGILKLMVPRWLDEAPMARLIAEKRWAHIRHGGEGALYVYLRKAKA